MRSLLGGAPVFVVWKHSVAVKLGRKCCYFSVSHFVDIESAYDVRIALKILGQFLGQTKRSLLVFLAFKRLGVPQQGRWVRLQGSLTAAVKLEDVIQIASHVFRLQVA